MLEDFYQELAISEIKDMFPKDMKKASKKSASFFIELWGGPPGFSEQYGPPNMRARHLRFSIDEKARLEWLRCFFKILENATDKYNMPKEDLEDFKTYLTEFSKWMINKAES